MNENAQVVTMFVLNLVCSMLSRNYNFQKKNVVAHLI